MLGAGQIRLRACTGTGRSSPRAPIAVGTKIERRGVVATYKLHDRVGANRASRRRFAQERPQLDETQQRIVDALRTEGFACSRSPSSFPDRRARGSASRRTGERFVDETEAGLAAEAAGGESGLRRTSKEFVVRKNAYGVALGLDDPWLDLAVGPRMLDLANTYLDLWSKLEYVDLWYTKPADAEAERQSSQRWHRDYNDRHLLKAFVYLSDVDERGGPVRVRPAQRPRRRARRPVAVAPARRQLPAAGRARDSGSRAGRSRRSPARRGR